MHKDLGASQSTSSKISYAEATSTESQTPCADLRCTPPFEADIPVEKASERYIRAYKLANDLRKSKKKELIKSKR